MSFTRIIETGTYTGNSSTQSISIGWKPAAIWIASSQTTNPNSQHSWSIKTDTMPDDDFQSNDSDSRYVTVDGITLTADGFDVGASPKINKDTKMYFFIAFRSGPQVDTGTYTGDDVGGRKITTGRQPAMVMTMEATGSDLATVWKWANVAGRLSAQFRSVIHVLGCIGILPDGFDLGVGTDGPQNFLIRVNVAGETYHWMALYEFDGSTRQFELGDWNGNDADPQKITTGQQPKFVMVYGRTATSIQEWAFLSVDYPLDRTSVITFGSHIYSSDTERRMNILSDGFEANGILNESGQDYRYIAGYF